MTNLDNLSTDLKDLEVNIEQYPNAESSHLIDQFILVGYSDIIKNEKVINKIKSNVISKKIKYNDLDILKSEEIRYLPSALFSMIGNSNILYPEEKVLIQYFFPSPLTIYYCNKEHNKEPEIEKILYNRAEIEAKIINSGYAYLFYEKEIIELNKKESIIFYFPKAFIFISQYNYFYTFHKICEYLHKQFLSDKVEIPIEIQIYNIINFIPCPFDNKLELSIFDTDLSSIVKFNNYEEYKSLNRNHIDIERLKGYRHSEINFCKIFEYFSPEDIVHIFLQSLAGYNCAFFSRNRETLNFILFVFTQFLFPLTAKEFVYSFNPNKFFMDEETEFRLIFGYLCSFEIIKFYNPFMKNNEKKSNFLLIEDENINKINEYEENIGLNTNFIVDIDQGIFKIYEKESGQKNNCSNDDEIQRQKYLFSYFENLLNDDKKLNENIEITLDILIRELYNKIKSLSILIKDKHLMSSFFVENEEIDKFSKQILECFLNFNVLISNDFIDTFFDYNEGKDLESNKKKKENLNISEIELCYYKHFENNTANILYNIVLECTESPFKKASRRGFDNLLTIYKENNNNKLLIKEHCIDLLDCVFKKKDSENSTISFFEFNKFFYDNLRLFIYKSINKDYIEKKMIKKDNINNYYYKYKKIDLDNDLLLKYCYYLDDLDINVKNKIFPTSVYINNSIEKIIHIKDYYKSYDKFFFTHKIFSFKTIIEFCILNILVLSTSEVKFSQFAESIYSLIREMNFGIRKYAELILNVSYRILVKKHITDVNEINKYFYIYKKILIEEKKILPNDELLILEEKIKNYIDAISDPSGINPTNTSEETPKPEEDNLFKFTPEIVDKSEFNIEVRDNWEKEGEIKKKISLSSELLGNNEISSDNIYYPYTLYLKLNELIDKFYISLDINSVDKDEYNKLIINVIYYFRFIKDQFPKDIMNFLFLCIKK